MHFERKRFQNNSQLFVLTKSFVFFFILSLLIYKSLEKFPQKNIERAKNYEKKTSAKINVIF